MKHLLSITKTLTVLFFLISFVNETTAQELRKQADSEVSASRVTEYIHWYPAIKQAEMRDKWLSKYNYGEWQFTGMVTAKDHTVVTPQSDTNYGYSWFNISNKPVVISMPDYDKYYSLSVFDMNHFMEVYIKPDKAVVVRLPHQKSPIKDAYEIILHTYQGLAFTRQVIVDNVNEVMNLAKKIKIQGGGGDFPFVIPDFTEAEKRAGMKEINKYMEKTKIATKLFGSPYEGVGDMDRAAGVLYGQLGTQARYANYSLYTTDSNNKILNGTDSYEITVPGNNLMRNKKGYWSLTVYNSENKYLIPNDKNKYNVSSFTAKPNADGSYTLRINPNGDGDNALPTAGKNWYTLLRVYEPVDNIKFPKMLKK